MITLESGSTADDDAPGSSTGAGQPPVTTVTTSPAMTVPPPVDDTTQGPLDTGVFDTGEIWLDFPEQCSIFTQDCPPGFKCMPYSNDGGGVWNDVMCVPVAEDPGAPGDPCTVQGNGVSGLDDCDVSSMCWDVDLDTNEGVCVAHCIGDRDNLTCADRCNRCAIGADSAVALCLPTCDPVLQNCDEGQGCYPTQDYFSCVPDASMPGVGAGSPCEFINGCPAGLICQVDGSVPGCEGSIGCCTPTCALGEVDPCPGLLPGTVCMPVFGEGGEPQGCLTVEPGACMVP